MKRVSLLIVMELLCASVMTARADVRLPGIFSDSMVLQRDRKLPVWGWAAPGEKVTVGIAGQNATTTADEDGQWRVTLAPLQANGKPLELTVRGARNTVVLKEVVVGEVWLCGGQSNMAMGVAGSQNAAQEIATADLPQIRSFQASYSFSPVPQSDIRSKWTVCSPERVGAYSAAGFFFARYLHQELGVPVGIINVAKGSMPLQTFTSVASLKTIPSARASIEAYEPVQAAARQRVAWLLAQAQRDDQAIANAAPGTDVAQWTRVELPVAKDKALFPEPGIYWVRQEIEIPQAWVGRQLVIGGVDAADSDQAYLDGELVEGGIWVEGFGALSGRWYVLEPERVKRTRLTLAIRVLNVTGKPCFTGDPQTWFVVPTQPQPGETRLVLKDPWSMRQAVRINAQEMPAVPVLDPDADSQGSMPQGYYNTAILPVASYGLRGAIWYQGEGDSARPDYYAQALPAMITDWRRIWGQGDFAFGVVQLPNFHGRQQLAIDHGWSEFREAQARGVQAVKNAGLAVTIDIGEATNIHPSNKQDVGKRLALWALATVYGRKDLAWSGPVYRALKIDGAKARLRFDHTAGGLKARGDELTGFAIAGPDKVFHLAQAKIEGTVVIVWSDKVPAPVAVRYAWAENPVCNLYNQADLPAQPFRTDDWAVSEVTAAPDERIAPLR